MIAKYICEDGAIVEMYIDDGYVYIKSEFGEWLIGSEIPRDEFINMLRSIGVLEND